MDFWNAGWFLVPWSSWLPDCFAPTHSKLLNPICKSLEEAHLVSDVEFQNSTISPLKSLKAPKQKSFLQLFVNKI